MTSAHPQVLVPGHRRARGEAVEEFGDVGLDVTTADLGRRRGQVVGGAERRELPGRQQVLLDGARCPVGGAQVAPEADDEALQVAFAHLGRGKSWPFTLLGPTRRLVLGAPVAVVADEFLCWCRY